MDAWVAEFVMGWEPRANGLWTNNRVRQWSIPAKHIPRYSEDIRQAWTVVDEMVRKCWNAVINNSERHQALHRQLEQQNQVGPTSFEIQACAEPCRVHGKAFVFVAFERPGGLDGARVTHEDATHGAAAALAISRCALLTMLAQMDAINFAHEEARILDGQL